MTSGEPTWGSTAGTFDEYAARDSDCVLRVLLPASVDGRPSTWREVAAAMQRTASDVDGYTDWHALTELSGTGGPPPDRSFDHPAGIVAQECLARLTSVLESVTGAGAPFVAAQPVGWSSTTAPLVEVGSPPALGRRVGREVVEAPLAELAGRWSSHGFPGRAWAVGQAVAIAAPPYADSLVLSGGPDLREALLRSDLEVFPVSRSARCPITSA